MRVVHFEVHVSDPDRAADFYKQVFGWVVEKWEEGDEEYWTVKTGEDDEIGINGGMEKGPVGGYTCIIGVPDIDEYIEKVKEAGGVITKEKREIGGMGWLVYCKDVEGNTFGIFEPTM